MWWQSSYILESRFHCCIERGYVCIIHSRDRVITYNQRYLYSVFPYNYISSPEKLLETALPPIHEFYDNLNNRACSQSEYEYAQQVWTKFDCTTLQVYCLFCVSVCHRRSLPQTGLSNRIPDRWRWTAGWLFWGLPSGGNEFVWNRPCILPYQWVLSLTNYRSLIIAH